MRFKSIDLKTKKWLLCFLSLLLFWWALSASGTCSASTTPEPQTVAVEVAELNRLDSIFNQLSQVNGKLQNELTDSKTALIKSQAELKQLQLQIVTLKALSVNQENSLQKVNESFKEYAAEQKRTRLRIKAQRNAWAVAAIITCIGIVIK